MWTPWRKRVCKNCRKPLKWNQSRKDHRWYHKKDQDGPRAYKCDSVENHLRYLHTKKEDPDGWFTDPIFFDLWEIEPRYRRKEVSSGL